MFEILKKFCDHSISRGVSGIDIVIYQDGECKLRYLAGYRDLENKIPMNGKERYYIYSCSKVVTCTAALQLFEKGLFSLEDRLSDYMPEFSQMKVKTENGVKDAENPILIKHLFEMTAGFSYELESPSLLKCRKETNGKCPTREVMRYLAKEPLLFEPGDRWEYSLCHDVLAAFVEVVSGEKFEDYVKKNIFDKLSMNDSTFVLPEEEIDTITEQYRFEDGKARNIGKRDNPYILGSEYASGGAGMVSTVDDYIKFLEGLRKYELLKKETVDLMQTDRLTDRQKRTFWMNDSHGYGLGVRAPIGIGEYTDFGWGGAAGAFLAVDTKLGIALYLGMHLRCSPVQGIRKEFFRLAKAELLENGDAENVIRKLSELGEYNLTY